MILGTKRLRTPKGGFLTVYLSRRRVLLEFYLSTDLFESFLQVLSFVLGKAFLYYARSCVNKILCFLQAKTTRFLHSLNDLQLAGTSRLQDNIEVCLLFLSGSTTFSGTCNDNCSSSGFNSILILKDSSKFVNFLNCQVN